MKMSRNKVVSIIIAAVVLALIAWLSVGSVGADGLAMVRIPGKNYEIGKYEVTQAEWRTLMGDNPSSFKNCGETCPVEQVSWDDAQKFITKLNEKTGKQYRLPTEAEWAYACLGGSKTDYCGSNDANAVAWYDNNSGDKPHPTGQKRGNGYGLHDMSGNVFEWTEDCYEANCAKHVLRGGAWSSNSDLARVVFRGGVDPTFRGGNFGFRLARTLR